MIMLEVPGYEISIIHRKWQERHQNDFFPACNAEPEDNVKLRNFFSTDKKHLMEGLAEPKDLAN